MSDYRLDVNGHIGLNEYSNIYDYMDVVDAKDNFTISLDEVANENIEIICTMLRNKNFKISYTGNRRDGRYYIAASKLDN